MSDGYSQLANTIQERMLKISDKPVVVDFATMQQDNSIICDNYQVPIPFGEYQTVGQVLPPGKRALVAWVGTEPVIINPSDGETTTVRAEDVATTLELMFVSKAEKDVWNAKQSAIGFTPENSANKGQANGYAALDTNGKLITAQIPDSVLGQVEYQGTWNAASNTPALTASPGYDTKGHYYVTSVAGTQFSKSFEVGDWIISNGTTWDKVDNTDAVSSVNGKTGVVVLTKGDVGLGNVNNTSDADKPVSTAQATAIGAKMDNTAAALGALVNGATAKTTPVDADSIGLVDSAASNVIKKLTWANIKATLKTYFDTLYAATGHTHPNATTAADGLMSKADKTKLDAISGTNTGNETTTTIGALINGAAAKTTPTDADMIPLMDSAASNITKKLSWTNIKSTLKAYFDTLYLTGNQTITLSGDATGSGTTSIAVTVVDDSHTHDTRYYTETEIQTASISMRAPFINANGVPSSNLGNPTLAEMALFDQQFTNKTEFYDITKVTFQTSTDGVNWTDFPVSDTVKKNFLGGDSMTTILIPYGTPYFRIAVRASSYVYLNALYMYWSSNGHSSKVQVYKKHDSGAYTQHTGSNTLVGAWPGHLYLPFSTIPFNPGATLGVHFHEVYFVFIPTWNASYPSNAITLNCLQVWGGYPSGKRTLYSVDADKNATFPAKIIATEIQAAAATQSTDGLMSAADKTKLDGLSAAVNPFYYGPTAPVNTNQLWIDSTT